MFEVLDAVDGQGLADALDANHRVVLGRQAFELVMVAGWADVHNEDSVPTDAAGRVLPGMERARAYGGDGTPLVAEFATAELAPLLGTSPPAADNLLRDGLDLRHRHPRLWARITQTARLAAMPPPGLSGHRVVQVDPQTGEAVELVDRLGLAAIVPVPVWQARRIAQVCHAAGLSLAQALARLPAHPRRLPVAQPARPLVPRGQHRHPPPRQDPRPHRTRPRPRRHLTTGAGGPERAPCGRTTGAEMGAGDQRR